MFDQILHVVGASGRPHLIEASRMTCDFGDASVGLRSELTGLGIEVDNPIGR
jgi:hypothetical protein